MSGGGKRDQEHGNNPPARPPNWRIEHLVAVVNRYLTMDEQHAQSQFQLAHQYAEALATFGNLIQSQIPMHMRQIQFLERILFRTPQLPPAQQNVPLHFHVAQQPLPMAHGSAQPSGSGQHGGGHVGGFHGTPGVPPRQPITLDQAYLDEEEDEEEEEVNVSDPQPGPSTRRQP